MVELPNEVMGKRGFPDADRFQSAEEACKILPFLDVTQRQFESQGP